jgi:CIC family chloride channel protein
MQRLTVADAMRPIPDPIPAETRLPALVDRFANGRDQALPVVSDGGTYAGVITLDAIDGAADRPGATAGDLGLLVGTLDPRQRLDEALDLLLRSDADGLPVLSANGDITGWVSHRDILAAYQRLLRREHPTGRTGSPLGRASAPAVAAPST